MPGWHLHLRHEHGSIIAGRKSAERKNEERFLKMSQWLAACAESVSAAISHVDSTIRQESCEADCSLLPETHILGSKLVCFGTASSIITLDREFNQKIWVYCRVEQTDTHIKPGRANLATRAVATPMRCLLLGCLYSELCLLYRGRKILQLYHWQRIANTIDELCHDSLKPQFTFLSSTDSYANHRLNAGWTDLQGRCSVHFLKTFNARSTSNISHHTDIVARRSSSLK